MGLDKVPGLLDGAAEQHAEDHAEDLQRVETETEVNKVCQQGSVTHKGLAAVQLMDVLIELERVRSPTPYSFQWPMLG